MKTKVDTQVTKKVDTMRETRLWIKQIIIPVITLITTTMTIPEVREVISEKAKLVKESMRQKNILNEEDAFGQYLYQKRQSMG